MDAMARYKRIDVSPRFLAVDLRSQLVPGTFEYALDWIIDHEIDLARFDARFKNDTNGAPAYPPALLLKVVLFAYSRGMVSSRQIERACREQVTFIALSGDEAPHFTTLAGFVSRLGEHIAPLFAQVLYLCDRQGLIGREMFAIDGVKLPSNASKAKSGTRAEFIERAAKLEKAAQAMLARHREEDAKPETPMEDKAARKLARLQREAEKVRQWLQTNPEERKGAKGSIRKSNLTDNESAKMATSKGVLQGYCGVAAVDAKHQIIVEAQAHGTGSEQALLVPVVEAIVPLTHRAGGLDKPGSIKPGAAATASASASASASVSTPHSAADPAFAPASATAPSPATAPTLITADAGYHSEVNLAALAALNVEALIADNDMRSRDERFADQGKHRAKPDPLHDKSAKGNVNRHAVKLFTPADFQYDPKAGTCICPAGKSLYGNGANTTVRGRLQHKFQGAKRDCGPCTLREKCLKFPDRTPTRQVAFFEKNQPSPLPHTRRMKARIDSEEGRRRYAERFATVEPVFANIRHNKRLDRFTLRGQTKVDAQWKLFCLVHNIEKLAHHGYAR
jgi:transposase